MSYHARTGQAQPTVLLFSRKLSTSRRSIYILRPTWIYGRFLSQIWVRQNQAVTPYSDTRSFIDSRRFSGIVEHHSTVKFRVAFEWQLFDIQPSKVFKRVFLTVEMFCCKVGYPWWQLYNLALAVTDCDGLNPFYIKLPMREVKNSKNKSYRKCP